MRGKKYDEIIICNHYNFVKYFIFTILTAFFECDKIKCIIIRGDVLDVI